MKVLNLRCAHEHSFEGWFASEEDFIDQNARSAIACPLCEDHVISRMPSAPRLNLHTSRSSAEPVVAKPDGNADTQAGVAEVQTTRSADLQAAWLETVRHLMANTDDVGHRFAEEARRMHYGEEPQRGIRGQASPEEREALREEGIETMAIPVPRALKGPVQ